MKEYFFQFSKKSWFWLIAGALLMLFFVSNGHKLIEVFYFIASLLPIVIGTSYYIQEYLIPKQLIRKNYFEFIVKSFYTLVISLYLQYLTVFLAIYIFSLYQENQSFVLSFKISTLNLILYIIILLKSLIEIINLLTQKSIELQEIKSENKPESKEQNMLVVQYKRQHYPIPIDSILYVESLADYIKILTEENEIVCRERISKVLERLPSNFLRCHRSFIINKNKINTFSRLFVDIKGNQIPISRTYKKELLEELEK